MNKAEALEHANALIIPEFLYAAGIDAMNDERMRNEEAIRALIEVYFAEEDPGFDFSLVRELADRNRSLVDKIGSLSVENTRSLNLSRGLTDEEQIRGVAALQKRQPSSVTRQLKGDMAALTLVMSSKPYKGTVIGIDLETTGRNPDRGYIINVGYALMTWGEDAEPHDTYEAFFGVDPIYAETGIPMNEVHGITWDMLKDKPLFREDTEAQKTLLKLLMKHPFLAHNAAFEDSWLMLNLEGYAEGRKEGKILPIDTREYCRRLDEEVAKLPFTSKPASLESWARRRGTLALDENERHLALDDTILMLNTLKAELMRKNLLLNE